MIHLRNLSALVDAGILPDSLNDFVHAAMAASEAVTLNKHTTDETLKVVASIIFNFDSCREMEHVDEHLVAGISARLNDALQAVRTQSDMSLALTQLLSQTIAKVEFLLSQLIAISMPNADPTRQHGDCGNVLAFPAHISSKADMRSLKTLISVSVGLFQLISQSARSLVIVQRATLGVVHKEAAHLANRNARSMHH